MQLKDIKAAGFWSCICAADNAGRIANLHIAEINTLIALDIIFIFWLINAFRFGFLKKIEK